MNISFFAAAAAAAEFSLLSHGHSLETNRKAKVNKVIMQTAAYQRDSRNDAAICKKKERTAQ